MSGLAAAGWHPERAVEIVAGTPQGGGLDRAAHALLKAITAEQLLAVASRVVNVPGDGARKAWTYIDRYAGDAHVIAISSPNLTTDRLIGLTAFDHGDYTPLATLYTEYIAFVVRSDSSQRSDADLLRRLSQTAPVTLALSTALGNPNHVAVAQVVQAAGGDITTPVIRVFDTALDAIADVVAGQAEFAAVTAASAVQEMQAGRLRALAVSAPERLSGPFAATPTWAEHSVPCVIGAWRGATGPTGLGPEQVAFWENVLRRATRSSSWEQELGRHCWTPMFLAGDDLRRHLQRERADYASLLGSLGLLKGAG